MLETVKTALLVVELGLSGCETPAQAVQALGIDRDQERRVMAYLIELGAVAFDQWADLPKIKGH